MNWGDVSILVGLERVQYVDKMKEFKKINHELYEYEFFGRLTQTYSPEDIQFFCDLFVDIAGQTKLIL